MTCVRVHAHTLPHRTSGIETCVRSFQQCIACSLTSSSRIIFLIVVASRWVRYNRYASLRCDLLRGRALLAYFLPLEFLVVLRQKEVRVTACEATFTHIRTYIEEIVVGKMKRRTHTHTHKDGSDREYYYIRESSTRAAYIPSARTSTTSTSSSSSRGRGFRSPTSSCLGTRFE